MSHTKEVEKRKHLAKSPLVERLLIIDDDPLICRALERQLSGESVQMLSVHSGQDALNYLDSYDFAVVICDQNLPDYSGSEILERILKRFPHTTRILLTGDPNLQSAAEAVNRGQVFQFIPKPWDESAVKQALHAGLEKHRLLKENHRLQERIVSQNRELLEAHELLAKDLKLGATIHDSLLAGQSPGSLGAVTVEGSSMASREIDGDFFDCFSPHESLIDLVIGDVMGKGIPAALVATAVKTQILRFASPGQKLFSSREKSAWSQFSWEPREILTKVQEHLGKPLLDLEHFVSLFYARVNLRTRRLSFVDCGFTKPLWYRKKDDSWALLEGENLPLGVIEDENWEQNEVVFDEGDLFVFYSDGVTEAKSPEGELYGFHRLRDLLESHKNLAPKALVHLILRGIKGFTQSCDVYEDDLTILILRIDQLDVDHTSRVYKGQFLSDIVQADLVRDFIVEHLSSSSEFLAPQLQLAVNEAFCNICEHAYGEKKKGPVEICIEERHDCIQIEIRDKGTSFDPTVVAPPNLTGEQDHGFGLYLIRSIADELSYLPKLSEDGWNRLRLIKALEQEDLMELKHENQGNVLVITLKEKSLDARRAPQFKDCVTLLINENHQPNVVFDLDDLNFIDSSGLGSFLSVLRHVNQQGGDLRLARMADSIKAMFELVRMHKLFEIYPETQDAVRSFTK